MAAVIDRRWPSDWNERMAGQDCPMCRAIGKGDNDFWVHVRTGDTAEVFLERRSRLPGCCIVAWRHEHAAEPTELDPDHASQYWLEVLAVGRAVQMQFQPIKLNYMTLGNTVPHLHTHVVPRYLHDPAPGGRSRGRTSSRQTRCQTPTFKTRQPGCANCFPAQRDAPPAALALLKSPRSAPFSAWR
jgi:diadenosine tetraphosphate (Ap4A) HIT family hydrolase